MYIKNKDIILYVLAGIGIIIIGGVLYHYHQDIYTYLNSWFISTNYIPDTDETKDSDIFLDDVRVRKVSRRPIMAFSRYFRDGAPKVSEGPSLLNENERIELKLSFNGAYNKNQ